MRQVEDGLAEYAAFSEEERDEQSAYTSVVGDHGLVQELGLAAKRSQPVSP